MILRAMVGLELRRLAVRPLGWVLAALTLAELAWRFVLLLGGFLAAEVQLAATPGGPGYTDLVAVPTLSSMLTGGMLPLGVAELALLAVPLLSMSAIAGDRGNGTLALLFADGLPPWRIVLGKYLALLIWLGLWLALALAMPLALAPATTPDWGKLAAATLGIALELAALAAIGLACSAYAPHPALAASLSLLLGLALWLVNLGAQQAGLQGGVADWLAMSAHLERFVRGLVSTGDLAWFVLLAALALALAIRRVGDERERG